MKGEREQGCKGRQDWGELCFVVGLYDKGLNVVGKEAVANGNGKLTRECFYQAESHRRFLGGGEVRFREGRDSR